MKHNFYPVIHIQSVQHALENTLIALNCRVDGVFLINMGDTSQDVLKYAVLECYNKFGKHLKIGVNWLCYNMKMPIAYGELQKMPDLMIWSDVLFPRFKERYSNTYYGPYAFKYQPQPIALAADLKFAENFWDVTTTSGSATGHPPSLQKIQTIAQYSSKPLAIASGISVDNVRQFKPYVRDFLVGTSIGYENLDPFKTQELGEIIHE